ncbi:uncharacterized protein LOC134276906 isoform X2 [Saccostrea cucullata]|uniref:uncharacterized protein LOC134276906 isoform X2 n=1 Tax=Saccostrea cuccullata TaxID=36930 RepID=UPI002ED3BB6F
MAACNVSLSTLQKVSNCPRTEKEVKEAKLRKDCESLAEVQNCSPPGNFSYHCVINFWANETYEVCAPSIYSQGRCLEFNQYGKVIQELDINCADKGCPKRFRSEDILSYAVCGSLVTGRKSKACLNRDWNTKTISFLVLSGVLFFLLAMVSIFLCRKERKDKADMKDLTGEELTNDAIDKITVDYESRKQRKKTVGNPNRTSRLENSIEEFGTSRTWNVSQAQLSENAKRLTISDSHVSIKQGFDSKTFIFFLKRHNLQDCREILNTNKIDCLQTFFELDKDKLQSFGPEYGQVLKCIKAKKSILKET